LLRHSGAKGVALAEPERYAATLVADFCRLGGQRSVYVRDLSAEWSVAKNEHLLIPPASIGKLLLAYAVVEADLDLDDEIDVAALGHSQYPTVLAAFDRHRRFRLRELLRLSLITSDNAAADLFGRWLGPAQLEEQAARIGMTMTRILGRYDDAHIEALHGETTTAQDVAVLLMDLWKRRDAPPFDMLWQALLNNIRGARLPALLPDDVPVAHKTGSLDGVVNDAGIIVVDKHPLLVVALSKDTGDAPRVSRDIARLAFHLFASVVGGEAM
jgi:beta-lactamase class A